MFREIWNACAVASSIRPEVRLRSKRLFGNAYMLEVCAGLSAVQRTNLTALLGPAGPSPSLYAAPLRRLVDAGLLMLDPQPEDDRRERWYRPTPTDLWRVARELAT